MHIVDIDKKTLVPVGLLAIVIPSIVYAFIWKTSVETKADKVATIEEKVQKIAEDVAEIKGMLKK